MIYLLDTDTMIFLSRGSRPAAKAAARHRAQRIASACQSHQSAGDRVALSAITLSELEYGARGCADYAKEKAAIEKLAAPFAVFEFDALECPLYYGQVRHDLELAGTPIGAMDQLLAAHALALDATLVTNNVAHFERVPNLRIVNWS